MQVQHQIQGTVKEGIAITSQGPAFVREEVTVIRTVVIVPVVELFESPQIQGPQEE
jgi:hypothetical protein